MVRRFTANSTGLVLDATGLLEEPGSLLDAERLDALAGRSILGVADFDRPTVIALARAAALLESTVIGTRKPLEGKIVITAFFEASTRTRLSFESAILRLDGRLLSVPDGQVTGIAKGESLADIGEMFTAYGDAVVMRHFATDSIAELGASLGRPLVNAGNGSGEHPTQALLDWYALLKWRPAFALDEVPADQRVHLGIIGTPGNMRAVKSFLGMALMFPAAISRITIVSELSDPIGADGASAIADSPIPVDTANDVVDVLDDLDVIYMNSIALLGDSYRQLDARFRLDARSPLKDGAVIMHPLARREELDTSLDATEHNMYFAQAAGAVFSRQALLTGVLGRAGRLSELID